MEGEFIVLSQLQSLVSALGPSHLISDIDGVLTDGTISISENGLCSRSFNMLDGAGQFEIQRAGLVTGFISSSKCRSGIDRLFELGASFVSTGNDGFENKLAALRHLEMEHSFNAQFAIALGDDLADLALVGHVGLFIAPNNAAIAVKETADLVLDSFGGHGFYREVCEAIIDCKSTNFIND